MFSLAGSGLQRLICLMAILALIFSLLTFNAFPGDSLMYHLPFAIRFWHLDSWPDFTGYFEDRYQGFPILWRILLAPGLFFREPRLLILPNLLALAGLCWTARKYLFLSWPASILACLCFPVSLFGFASSMQDFFIGCTALSGALALFSANLQTSQTETKRAFLVGLAMLALSVNVKLQGFLLGVVILFLAAIFSFSGPQSLFPWRQGFHWQALRFRVKNNFRFLVTLVLLLCLIVAQPVSNLYRFQNPFFPISFGPFKGSEGSNISTIPYVPVIPVLYNGLTFLSSSLEIDPILRSAPGIFFRRSVHMQNPVESARQPADQFGNRWVITGGSNGILYAFILTGAVLSLWRNRRLPGAEITHRQRTVATIHFRLMLSFLVTLFLPQTLELRYYMYNLFVPCFVVISSPSRNLQRWMSWAMLAGTAFALLSAILVPFYFWIRTHIWLHEITSWDVLHARPSLQVCKQYVSQLQDEKQKRGSLSLGTVKVVVLCGFGDSMERASVAR